MDLAEGLTTDRADDVQVVDSGGQPFTRFSYRSVPVSGPYCVLLDRVGNYVQAKEAHYRFGKVLWRYQGDTGTITDYGGLREQPADSSYVVPRAWRYQVVPALQGATGWKRFVNNDCHNPAYIQDAAGGRLAIAINDNHFEDNEGGFALDVFVPGRYQRPKDGSFPAGEDKAAAKGRLTFPG